MTKFGQIIFCVWQRRIWKITNYETDKVKGFNSHICIFLEINYLYIWNTNKIRDSRTKMGRSPTKNRVFGFFQQPKTRKFQKFSYQDWYLMSLLVAFIFRKIYFRSIRYRVLYNRFWTSQRSTRCPWKQSGRSSMGNVDGHLLTKWTIIRRVKKYWN